MTRLEWGKIGDRFYEAGVDRGVLYRDGLSGVPWNGLISIKESVSGGEPMPFYLDGIKILNVLALEDFAATLDAFSAPPEFSVCDGTGQIANGLFVTQQPRVPFGLSYRSKIGNDIQGLDLGYKIHFVYNALASPAARNSDTLNATVSPSTLSWGITTTPVAISGFRSGAHLILDSRLIDSDALMAVENFLYGTSDTSPALPTPEELVTLLEP